MTDQELHAFAQRLLPLEMRECTECGGMGYRSYDRRYDGEPNEGEDVISGPKPIRRCRCGGSGMLRDNRQLREDICWERICAKLERIKLWQRGLG